MLEHQIDSNLYGRQGKTINNFAATLPHHNPIWRNRFSKTPIISTSLHSARMPRNVIWSAAFWSTFAPF